MDSFPDLFKIPVNNIQSKFVEFTCIEESDQVFYIEFAKDDEMQNIYINKSFLEVDPEKAINFLKDGFGEVNAMSYENRDTKKLIVPNEFKQRYKNKAEFFSIQNVPQDNCILKTNELTVLKTTDGAYINIPKDAFVTSTGAIYRGYVDFTYRQWNSTAEMLDSKLPLYEIENTGDTVFYITNGMYEMRAYDENNKELQIANDKSIGILYTVINDPSGFNLYSFNEDSNNWDELGTLEENKSDVFESLPIVTDDNKNKSIFNQRINRDSLINTFKYEGDSTKFKNRYYDLSYTNLIDNKEEIGGIPYYSNGHFSKTVILPKKKYNGRNIIRPILDAIKVNDTLSYYKITFNNRFYQRYPEAHVFENRMWIPTDLSRKEFRKNFFTYKKYNDVSFSYEGGVNFIVELKSKQGFNKIEIQPYYPHFGKKKSTKLVKLLVRKYDKLYKKKEDQFDANITRKMSDFIMYRDRAISVIVNGPLDSTNQQGSNVMYANLNMRTLGLTNIDQKYLMPQRTMINPAYVAEGKRLKGFDFAQIIDETTPGVFQFNGTAFIYSKKNIAHVIVTDKDGNKYMASNESIKKLKKYHGGHFEIEFIPFEENKSQIQQLAGR